jgi:molybdate transport system ATP-binding protein
VVVLDQATVSWPGGPVVFRVLSWTVREGQTWAIVGPVGSGKTTLAEVLRGLQALDGGSIHWPLLDRLAEAGQRTFWPSEAFQHLTFREDSWLFSYSRHYYQQRFNFIEPQDDLTLESFLRSPTAGDSTGVAMVAEQLGIDHLRSFSLIKLSSGQMRRARIARALLAGPEVLILDDPFAGLDQAGRSEVAVILGSLVRQGQRLILITRPDAVPSWVTDVLELPGPTRPQVQFQFAQGCRLNQPASAPRSDEPIIELRNVSVGYGDRMPLQNVSWTVRAGERWAVLGPNGAGKTTPLSLLCGDHPQAYSNDIRLFGRSRGSGETIWEIKQFIGLLSPELHLYFTEPLTAQQAAATGFFDALVCRATTPQQDAAVRERFGQFGITTLAQRLFARLSTGEQRLVLLIRALVKEPALLILDEPFQGLDGTWAARLRDWIDQRLRPDQTLLFVSHHPEEVPHTVANILRLDRGRESEA